MRFWISHALIPLIVFSLLVFVFQITEFDLIVSNKLFNFDTRQWFFGESWWATTVIHKWGRNFIAVIFLVAIVVWFYCLLVETSRKYWFRPAYVFSAILFSTGIVAIIKHFTNIDCPWDLSLYNGSLPYYNIFSSFSGESINGRCFPGGHSSGGFSLFLFYFLLRDYSKRYAYTALFSAMLIGLVFSFGQWVRGAHFVSHDMWSAMIAWFVALFLYKLFYQPMIQILRE